MDARVKFQVSNANIMGHLEDWINGVEIWES